MIADKIKNARTILYYITILVDESHRLRRYYSKTNHILAGTNPHWIDKSVRWGFSCIEESR